MEIRFRRPVDQAELSSLRGVTVTAAERPRVTLDVTGEIGPVLRVIASHDPVDLTSRPADLDSLFYWSVGNDQITRGVSPVDFTILITVGLCALAASVAALRNADLN
jgi:hypothetical protein